jgi:hypothetical protein
VAETELPQRVDRADLDAVAPAFVSQIDMVASVGNRERAIAVRNVSERRRWSKLNEWLILGENTARLYGDGHPGTDGQV